MKYKLRTKISIAFLMMTLILFVFISLSANYFLQEGFKDYIVNKLDEESNVLAAQVSSRYIQSGKSWDINGIESIGIGAMERGMIIKVITQSGSTIWDARVYNKGFCSDMLTHMEMNMRLQMPDFTGGYEEKKYDLISNGQVVGKLYVGYYGPYYYNDNDIRFLKTLNELLLWASALALVLSIIIGAFLSQRLTRPIGKVIENAKRISKGEFDVRVNEKSNTKEIEELTNTINDLGKELGRQESLRKRLSSDVAHELRTPVATLQSHFELILEGIWKPTEEIMRSCYEEVTRLGSLIGELGEISRLEDENLVLHKELIYLNHIVSQVVQAVKGEFFKKNITLEANTDEIIVFGDSGKLKQVIMNIVMNAFHYTPSGGAVKVSLRKVDGVAEISVEDTGIGIPEQDLENIFERFYRVDKSRARNSGGTGIGLALVKAYVRAHNGTIKVKSEENIGSCFTIRLPLWENTD